MVKIGVRGHAKSNSDVYLQLLKRLKPRNQNFNISLFENVDLVTSIALKLEINITIRLNVADYPSLTFSRVSGGHLADFGALEKILIALERKRPTSSAFHRSKEYNFLYRMAKLEVQIE